MEKINVPNISKFYKDKYIKQWNVVEKIKRAKKEGTFR